MKTRKANSYIYSIMQPRHIKILEQYRDAKQAYRTARDDYHQARAKYNAMVSELNAIIYPNEELVYAYIGTLRNDYLLDTPRAQVWRDMVDATGVTTVTQAKFGRMMKEYGFIRTTKHAQGSRMVARWRNSSEVDLP